MNVIDKNGNRVVRHNGILQDGDRMTVPLKMMDNSLNDPGLIAAMAAAEAVKRAETFDKKTTTTTRQVIITGALSPDEVQALQDAHNANVIASNANHRPGYYFAREDATSINVADAVRQSRDERMNAAWLNNPADAKPLVIDHKKIDARVRQFLKFPAYRPGFRVDINAINGAEKQRAERQARMNNSWRNPAPSPLSSEFVAMTPNSDRRMTTHGMSPGDLRDENLSRAWMHAAPVLPKSNEVKPPAPAKRDYMSSTDELISDRDRRIEDAWKTA